MLEHLPLLKRQAVRLGDNGDNVHNLAELLHHNDIDRPEGVAGRVDEEQAAVDTRVLDMAVTLRGELLAEVRAVLVLDVLDDRIPAKDKSQPKHTKAGLEDTWNAPVFVIDHVTVAWRVHDVQPQTYAIFTDNYKKLE